jgi:hypothetical protein
MTGGYGKHHRWDSTALEPNLLENVGLCTEDDIPSVRPPHILITGYRSLWGQPALLRFADYASMWLQRSTEGAVAIHHQESDDARELLAEIQVL